MFEPTLHVRCHGDLGRFQVGTAINGCDQSGALNLSLPLRPGEGVPFAPPFAGRRIAHVQHDGPVTGRAFAYVALHGRSPCSTDFDLPPRSANPAMHLARQRLRKRSPGPSREYAIIVAWASN